MHVQLRQFAAACCRRSAGSTRHLNAFLYKRRGAKELVARAAAVAHGRLLIEWLQVGRGAARFAARLC
jgi:hypothetical protein